jgi:hypothetical protein
MATGPAALRVHGRIVGPDPVIRMPSGVHLIDFQGVQGFVDEFRLRRHPAEGRSCPGLHGGDRDIGLTGLVTSWSPGGAVDCSPGGHDVCCRSDRRLELHGAAQRLLGPPDGAPRASGVHRRQCSPSRRRRRPSRRWPPNGRERSHLAETITRRGTTPSDGHRRVIRGDLRSSTPRPPKQSREHRQLVARACSAEGGWMRSG